jgi:hypothetical protein
MEMKQKSIDELAMEYVILTGVKKTNYNDLNKHMHEMYIIYEEICRRIGYKNTEKAVNKASQILKIIIP